ncbi:Lrp/AsnC family transcriptional regulator [Pseudonocardia abyssalis]|jgi:DNA-binding Lrp family transcriptional regulator|uniref:Lrp/AsnC family transcriptional regulator n=1 Tax=Pseudonocardia abyssalis TaxID=2792008 RepID=A0ABS6UR23_9PSEU|nr:Lrp/AsnC family transcriptional regulator [Pseudonocardia abyssalis]MBW0115955.1 Lrp/AsnC family transcriptional regulator [Pseudonocardia abyssalis]MBW0134716.1 Lrp/AsnC family transcriptional regulator [Pseudonocardia abyssalis]
MRLDELDRSLLVLLLERPRAGLREHARTLGVARGTVAARFLRLQESGVVSGLAPQVSPRAFGYAMLAFVHLDLAQGRLDPVVEDLTAIPEVIEAHTITGDGDLLCRVVARDTAELERVIQRLIEIPGVTRTRSQMALTQRIPPRVLPLVRSSRWSTDRPR